MKIFVVFALALLPIFVPNSMTASGLPGSGNEFPGLKAGQQMNRVAEEFIVLAFCLSKADENYVDSYFGPPEMNQKGLDLQLSLQNILEAVNRLARSLQQMDVSKLTQENRMRHRFLSQMIRSMSVRVKILEGEKLSFDQESEGIYDVTLPEMDLAEFQRIRKQLDALVPGQGELGERLKKFRRKFIIPAEKVEAVFEAALKEARTRTQKWLPLREDEKFTQELVKNQPWLAYNWFKGNGSSLIQLNTDIPLTIDQMVGLACHEGYPGHHVFHGFMEKVLYREKGWPEFSIYPLFSSMSVVSEGLANFGIDLAFPDDEQLKFETEILCPLAGIDPEDLEKYHLILNTSGKLRNVRNLIARDFLDGRISEEKALENIRELLARSPESAKQSLEFIKTYRSYILTYSIGEVLVRKYILKKAGSDHPEKQWKEYLDLMTRPVLPEDLREGQKAQN